MSTLNVHSSFTSSNYKYCKNSVGNWQERSYSTTYGSYMLVFDRYNGSSGVSSYRMAIKIPAQTIFSSNQNTKITNISILLDTQNIGGNSSSATAGVYLVDSIEEYKVSGTPSLKLGQITIATGVKQSYSIAYNTTTAFSGDKWLLFIPENTNGYYYKQIKCTNDSYPQVTFTYYSPYTITYNANGGTGAPSAGKKIHDEPFTLSDTKPTKNSTTSTYTISLNGNGGSVSPTSKTQSNTITYSFLHWNTKADNTGTTYDPGSSYKANSNLTLYAQYSSLTKGSVSLSVTSSKDSVSENGFTISFDSEGGSNTPESIKTTRTISYSLTGWKDNSSGTFISIEDSVSFSSDVTLYAQWDPSYTENSVVLSVNAGEKEGYNFKGWSQISSSSGETQTLVDTTNFITTSDVILYAVWEPMPFTITLDGNGGTFPNYEDETTISISNVIYGWPYKNFITSNEKPEQEGKVLSYWTLNADGSGTQIKSDSIVSINGSHTLYANYVSSYYVIAYIYFNNIWIPLEPLNYQVITSGTTEPTQDTSGDIYIQIQE